MSLTDTALFYRAKALLYVLVLSIFAAPFCIVCSLVGVLLGSLQSQEDQTSSEIMIPSTEERRTVLVSGAVHTKGLHIAKTLAKAGHKVILADSESFWFSASRFSRYIHKFCTVPNISVKGGSAYVDGMVDLAIEHKVDWYIPVSHTKSSVPDSMVKEVLSKRGVKCLIFDPHQTKMLDDKTKFMEKCRELKLSVPDYEVVESIEDVIKFATSSDKVSKNRYFLKPLAPYSKDRENFTPIPSDSGELKQYLSWYEGEISPKTPYLISQFIQGRELVMNCVVSNGNLQAYQICSSSPMQIDYDVVEHPKIYQWVQEFCARENLTGCPCFDFLEDEKTKEIYCIECNPRVHSAIVAFDMSPELARALSGALNEESTLKPVTPSNKKIKVYWLYNELGKMLHGQQSMAETFQTIISGKDALWDCQDMIPFLMMNTLHMTYVLWQAVMSGKRWKVANFCLGGLR